MLHIDRLWVIINNIVFQATPINHGLPVYPETLQESRIVSGWEAEEGQFPYQLSIRMINLVGAVNGCGASIIHAEWGLTAAHCTAASVTFVVRAGAVSLTRPVIIFETTVFYNHPLYKNHNHLVVQPNDIALLKFGRTLIFTPRVQPIRLQRSLDKNKNYDDIRLIAASWGRQWNSGESPVNLTWVYLRGVSNFDCWLQYQFSPIISDSTICAQYYNVTSQSACQGDNVGNPIIEEEDGIKTQVGVTSFVDHNGCHTPAGFVRPGHYHKWFTEVTGINFDWIYYVNTTTTVGTVEPESRTTNLEFISETEDTTAEPEFSTTTETETEDTAAEPEYSNTTEPETTDTIAEPGMNATKETELTTEELTEVTYTTVEPELESTTPGTTEAGSTVSTVEVKLVSKTRYFRPF